MRLAWKETDRRTGYFYVRWVEWNPEKKREITRGRSFRHDKAAQQKFWSEKNRELSRRKRSYVDEAASPLECYHAYLEDAELAGRELKTLQKITSCVKPFAQRFKKIGEITTETLVAYRSELFRKKRPDGRPHFSAHSVWTHLATLRTWLRWGQKNRWFAIGEIFDASQIEMPDVSQRKENDFDDSELPILETASKRNGILGAVRFAYMTGLRLNEQLGALWSNLRNDHLRLGSEETKDDEARGVILRPEVLAVLPVRGPGRIFEALTEWTLRRRWRNTLRDAGLTGSGRTWHSLRKTFARLWMEGGGQEGDLLEAAGWKDERSARPYRVYSHQHMRSRWQSIQFPGRISSANPVQKSGKVVILRNFRKSSAMVSSKRENADTAVN